MKGDYKKLLSGAKNTAQRVDEARAQVMKMEGAGGVVPRGPCSLDQDPIQNAELRDQAQQRLTANQKEYDAVLASLREAGQSLQTLRTDLDMSSLECRTLSAGCAGHAERLTRARQTGHDGSDGNAHDVGELAVRQTFELAKHEQFTKTSWQAADGALDQRDVIGLQQQLSGSETGGRITVLLFIEWVGDCLQVAAAPAMRGVANDPQEPGSSISAGKCPKVAKGPQRRFLHDIFRIGVVPHQPTRQTISRIEVGQDHFLKAVTDRGSSRGGAHVCHSWWASDLC